MATGGIPQRSFKDLLSNASGDAIEAFCDPCCNMGKWVTVKGYCQTCQEHLCDICLGVHKNQKMTRGHTILDKNQMPGGQEPYTKQDLCVEVCKTHHPEIVRFYCKAHDKQGCVDCMTIKHASCTKDKVQDISDGFQPTNEFKLLQHNLEKLHDTLEEMKDALDDNLKNQDITYNNIQHKITSYRKHINDYLDKIQKQITDEAAEMKQTYETETNKLIAKNESLKSELENKLQNIQKYPDVNENSIFVAKMKSQIAKLEQSIPQQQHYGFCPSIEIEQLVSASTPLGKLVRKPNINTTASYRETIDLKRGFEGDCQITDCTLLAPDRMVVTDKIKISLINLSIKQVRLSYLSINGKISSSSSCFTCVQPYGVTAVSTDKVAVTLPNPTQYSYQGKKHQILLLNVAEFPFTIQHVIQVNKECQRIAYKDGKFAVGYKNQGGVEILDMQGQVLHTVHRHDHSQQCPAFIAFGQYEDTVIVSSNNKVNVVTFKGQILHTYTHWEGISGIAITPDGVLFVCSQGSKDVHAVSSDLRTSKTIIYTEVNPKSISYCDINHRLYIINEESTENKENTIKVYDLKL